MENMPFEVLAASIHDGRSRILELADENTLLGNDEDVIRRAVAVLLNPDKRICAEVAWSPLSELLILSRRGDETQDMMWLRDGYTIGNLNDMAANLLTALEERRRTREGRSKEELVSIGGDGGPSGGAVMFDKDGKAQIALSNKADFGSLMEAFTHVFRRGSVDVLQPDRLCAVILSLSRNYEVAMNDPRSTLDWINDRRKTSGFPRISNIERIKEEIEYARRRYRSTIATTLQQITEQERCKVVTRVIKDATHSGVICGPLLVYNVINDYEVGVTEELEKELKVITAHVERINRLVQDGKSRAFLDHIVREFESVVERWGNVVRPIQIGERSQGREHKASVEVAWKIRNLAVYLYNEHILDCSKSIRLLELTKRVFSYLGDEIDSRIGHDLAVLERAAPNVGNMTGDLGRPIKAHATVLRAEEQAPTGWKRALSWVKFVLIVGILGTVGIMLLIERWADHNSSTDKVEAPRVEFVKPAVGKDRSLGMPELRWCVRQDYAIEFRRKAADTNDEVNRFNAMVEDYNSRCGSFRYREGDLERARQDVERLKGSDSSLN